MIANEKTSTWARQWPSLPPSNAGAVLGVELHFEATREAEVTHGWVEVVVEEDVPGFCKIILGKKMLSDSKEKVRWHYHITTSR